MINYELLKNGKLSDYPYRSAKFEDLIPLPQMEELRKTFPKDNYRMYVRKMGHDKTYKLCGRPFIVAGENKIYEPGKMSDIWKALFEDLMSKEYWEAMETLLGMSLKNHILGVDFWRFEPGSGCYISSHPDVEWKTVTHLFYFVKTWKAEWGGRLGLHDCTKDNDLVDHVIPSMRISPLLVRSDRSFHSIEPVKKEAPESRKVLDIVFYNRPVPAPKLGRVVLDIIPENEFIE